MAVTPVQKLAPAPTARPAIARSTSSPSRTTNVPPTSTYGMPADGWWRVLVGGAVDHRGRVEDDEIGVGADLDAALLRHGRARSPRGGAPAGSVMRASASSSVSTPSLAHVAAEHARVRAGAARVLAAVVHRHAVRGDHHARVAQRLPRLQPPACRGSDHAAALAPVSLEALLRQSLARRRPTGDRRSRCRCARCQPVARRAPTRSKRRGRRVGVHLGRHEQALGRAPRRSRPA